jgi:hypothetical protein
VADRQWPLRSAALTAAKGSHCHLLGYDTVQPGNSLPVAPSSSILNATSLLQPTLPSRTYGHCLGKLKAANFFTGFPRKNVVCRIDDERISKARQQENLLTLLYLSCLRLSGMWSRVDLA